MKRLLLNCDQVFDVLTRGPFPTGEPEDEAVERHLRACHECRRLAEALRPAVALLHEAVSTDQAVDLPEYQGSLPNQKPTKRRLSFARLAATSTMGPTNSTAPRPTVGEPRQPQTISAVRFVAASLLLAGVALWFSGSILEPGTKLVLPRGLVSSTSADLADGMPNDKGLLTLASLKLPVACLPLTHRPLSTEHAAQIAASLSGGSLEGLRCCTECHHAGGKRSTISQLAAIAQQSCQACHRG